MNIQNKFKKTNTIYKITKDMDLEGSTLIIPVGCTLDFQGGSFKNGTIVLSNNVKLIGNGSIYATELPTSNLYNTRQCKALIIGIGVSNITIEGIKFNISGITDRTIMTQSIIIYSHKQISSNISIQNCSFEGDGIGLFCNTQKVAIDSCTFTNCITNSVAFETLYDYEPYVGPSGLSLTNCKIDTTINSEESANIWISGAEKVLITDNNIATNGDGVTLYCGDGNIKLRDVTFINNKVVTYKSNKSASVGLTITGKSYVYPVIEKQNSEGINISNNNFISEYDNYKNKKYTATAIATRWVNNIVISKNYIEGYGFGITSSDSFRGTYIRVSELNIVENTIVNTGNRVINFDTNIEYANICDNTFRNYCSIPTTYADRFAISIYRKRNISICNNVFIDSGTNTVSLVYAQYSVNCKFLGNKNYGNGGYATFSTVDSTFRTEDMCDIGRGNKILYKNTSFPDGSFRKGDIIDISSSPKLSGNRCMTSFIVTESGTQGSAPNISFTGKLGENVIYATSASNNVRAGSFIIFDNIVYEVIDIDYDSKEYTLNKALENDVNTTPSYAKLNKEYYESYIDSNTSNIVNKPLFNSDGTLISKQTIVLDASKINTPNIIYKIVSDIDLNGETLTLPANVTLDFQGGSISNGVITGSSIKNTYLRPEWFGAKGDGITDDSVAFQMTVNLCKSTNCKVIELSESTYLIDNVIIPSNITLIGADKYKSILKSYANTLNTPILASDDIQGNNVILRNLTIESSGIRTEYTVKILNKVGVIIDNCYFVRHTIEGDPNDYHGIFIGRKEGTETTYITKFTNNRVNQCCVTIEGTDGYIDHNEIWGIGCQSALHLVKSGNHMISNNQIVGGSVYGAIYCTGWATALKLFGNYFDGSSTIVANVPYGLNVDCNLTYCTISNNNFWHIYGTAIRVKTCIGSVFNGNIFENNDTADTGAPDILLENTQSSSVSNNSFIRANVTRTNKAPVLNITGYTSTSYEPIIISGNIMRGYLNYSSAVYTPIDSVIKSINNNSQYFEYIKNNSPYRIFTSDGEINYISSTDISADPLASRVYTYLEGGRKPRLDNLTYIDAGNMPTSSKFDFSATYNKDFKLYIGSTTQVDNAPTWLTGGVWLENYYTANGYCVQRIFGASMIYTRTCNNNVWSSWYKIEGTALT